jgi:putative NADH-flavin reductase
VRLLAAGASGRTGRLFTALALQHGHEVTALVRDASRFRMSHERLRVVEGDALIPDTLPPALAGVDAVVSILAPRPRRDGRVYTEGTQNLADAAARAGVRRFVVVSAEGAGVTPEALPWAYRLVLRIPVVARLYPDIAQMERELEVRTDLDWTIVRAAVLTNGPRTGAYRTAVGDVVPRGLLISRADLAEFLLGVVERDEYVRQRVALAR